MSSIDLIRMDRLLELAILYQLQVGLVLPKASLYLQLKQSTLLCGYLPLFWSCHFMSLLRYGKDDRLLRVGGLDLALSFLSLLSMLDGPGLAMGLLYVLSIYLVGICMSGIHMDIP